MRKLIFAGASASFAALAIAGCTLFNAATSPVSPNDVSAVESALTAAEIAAKQYTQLPACPATTKICADPQTKASILAKDNTAYDAVQQLKVSSAAGAPALLVAAQIAISALQSTIPAPAIVAAPPATK